MIWWFGIFVCKFEYLFTKIKKLFSHKIVKFITDGAKFNCVSFLALFSIEYRKLSMKLSYLIIVLFSCYSYKVCFCIKVYQRYRLSWLERASLPDFFCRPERLGFEHHSNHQLFISALHITSLSYSVY